MPACLRPRAISPPCVESVPDPYADFTTYPLCVDGARACPPEDCGGVHGYENLLTVIQDPTHEEYESTLEWLGGRFDPDTFDPKRVKFDDPARRYQFAFEEPRKRAPLGRR